jgi:hypothetical protein
VLVKQRLTSGAYQLTLDMASDAGAKPLRVSEALSPAYTNWRSRQHWAASPIGALLEFAIVTKRADPLEGGGRASTYREGDVSHEVCASQQGR